MLDALKSLVQHYPGRRFVVGYSGGRDSHVLLHALSQFSPCVAFHVNHQLHPQADAWEHHCQEQARSLGCAFQSKRVHLPPSQQSLEALAREARYQALGDFLESGDILLTAHHSADQTESVLMALLRGSGPEGLKGIEPVSEFRKGSLVRPWLSVSPVEIADYAAKNKLTWITDTSNFDAQYTRNALRLHCLPSLLNMEPGLLDCVSRTARHCLESSELLNTLVRQRHAHRFKTNELCLIDLNHFSLSEQKMVLRMFIKSVAGTYPPHTRLETLLNQLYAPGDKMPQIDLNDGSLRRFKMSLRWVSALSLADNLPEGYQEQWTMNTPLALPNGKCLTPDLVPTEYRANPVTVMARQGDLPCHLGQRKTSLKNLFQSLEVPPWERLRYPLIVQNKVVVAIPGLMS